MCNSEQKKENNKPKEDENSNFICNLLKGAVGVFIVVILLFVGINIWGGKFFNEENTTLSNLGTIGDYFGGLINPLLGFVSFCALLYTIRIQMKSLDKQSEELELTREELRATKEELARSALAQEHSSAIFRQQQFETTFFSLVNQLNKEIDKFSDCNSDNKIDQSEHNRFIEYIKSKVYLFENEDEEYSEYPIDNVKDTFENHLNSLEKDMYYFSSSVVKSQGILKIILALVESSDVQNKKFYVNIVKSNLSKEMLYMIAIMGYENNDLRDWIEEYHLLEFMPFKFGSEEVFDPILRLIAHKYKRSAFGKNIYLQDVIDFEQQLISNQQRESSNAN